MIYKKHNPVLFRNNRKNFSQQMKTNSIAIFYSNDQMPSKGDMFFKYLQNPDLFYLSGLDQEESVVVIFPDCKTNKYREIAFIKKTNEHIAIWEGNKLSIEEAKEISGIKSVYFLDQMEEILEELIPQSNRIYHNGIKKNFLDIDLILNNSRHKKSFKKQYPKHKFSKSQTILTGLRMIKSEYEIQAIQKACDITEKAFRRILNFTKPGVGEWEIEAEIIHEFRMNKSSGPAYDIIAASGINACVLHYTENEKTCLDGEVILMDFGADYGNYAADLSRSIPINGRFSPRQKKVYNAVLSVMKAATNMLIPGTVMKEYQAEVVKLMESELIKLKLLDKTDIKNQSKKNPAYRKYFMHGTSHHLGLDVHDLSDRTAPFAAGMILTCEPGIYIKEEGLGIRLENDILITKDGPKDLMANIPIEIEEIEELMNGN